MIQFHMRRKFHRAVNTVNILGHLTCCRVLAIIVCIILFYKIYCATTPGRYSAWSVWSECPVTCGGGTSHRTRTCDNPTPGRFGRACIGDEILTRKCNDKPCPINGKYTQWGSFDKCDKSCGVGTKTRKRNCTNPAPKYGGKDCDHLGPPEEKHFCNVQPCPINGGYSAWGQFTNCEMQKGQVCGIGKRVRLRRCDNPVPQHGGVPCQGANTETVGCEIPCASPTLKPVRHIVTNTLHLDSTKHSQKPLSRVKKRRNSTETIRE